MLSSISLHCGNGDMYVLQKIETDGTYLEIIKFLDDRIIQFDTNNWIAQSKDCNQTI